LRVLVTGASGFIGGHLVPELARLGHDVSCMVRRTSNVDALRGMGVELRLADLADPGSLAQAVEGMEAVVHLAAYYGFYGRKELYRKLNVEGTRALAGAARKAGVEHFVYCSSTEAIGPVAHPPADEEAEPAPQFEYGRSKLEAEKAALAEGDGMAVSVIRSTGVYGPGNVDDVSYWFIMAMAGGGPMSWFVAGSGEHLIQFAHVGDVVQGLTRILDKREEARGETFIIGEGTAYTYNQVYGMISDILGVKPPRLHLPPWLVKLGVAPVEAFNSLLGRESFMWHLKTVDSVTSHRAYSVEKARQILGYTPKYSLREGLAETVDWYRANGYL
jgi:dihydroflavonol-4-reductase